MGAAQHVPERTAQRRCRKGVHGSAPARRSRGVTPGPAEARAFWLRSPVTVRSDPPRSGIPSREGAGPHRVSGVSRGTETLVFRGAVPPDQYAEMRAPFQEGDSPAPSSTATSTSGRGSRARRASRPHGLLPLPPSDRLRRPASAVTVVPEERASSRAVLAGTVETAVNALWDAAPILGDRVTVVGAGMVGCCVARLLRRFPGDAGDPRRRRRRPRRGRGRVRRRLRAARRRDRRS